MSRVRWPLLALVATVGAQGCLYDLECTDDVRYGVELEISEPGGPYPEPIEVRYQVDGGAWISDAVCPSRATCSIGPELAGGYVIEISRGAATVTVETRVAADRCHVITETIPVEIPSGS